MKIALCFLTYSNLSQPKLWRKIIDNNKDKINVYIHNKLDFVDNIYNLHEYCITRRVKTIHAHKSLVEAELRLFEEAYKDETNMFFILLSDKCIPLYNFDYIYKKIFEINSNIIFSYTAFFNYDGNIERYIDFNDMSFIKFADFRKDSQWILLNRKTTNFFINNKFLYLYKNCFYAVDEHYFGNICNKFKIPYVNKQITFVNWEEQSDNINERKFPKTYDILTNDMIEKYLKTKTFFLRKISENCNLPSYFDNLS